MFYILNCSMNLSMVNDVLPVLIFLGIPLQSKNTLEFFVNYCCGYTELLGCMECCSHNAAAT